MNLTNEQRRELLDEIEADVHVRAGLKTEAERDAFERHVQDRDRLRSEYGAIFSDPKLRERLYSEDQAAIERGDRRSTYARGASICERIERGDQVDPVDFATLAAIHSGDEQAQAAAFRYVLTGSAADPAQQVATDEDGYAASDDEYTSGVIEVMRSRRASARIVDAQSDD